MNSETISEELNLLLDNFWILKEDNPSSYYKIKKHLKELRDIANNKLGCDIICNGKLIKLEKLPTKDSNTYKIEEFDSQLDYVLFLVLLLFLEDKGLDDQFILSSFTEYVTNILASIPGTIKPDWKKYKDRKSLVDVLKYSTNLGIIRVRDGNDKEYADNAETEVLYENTTLSHYVIRQFKFDIFSCESIQDFLEHETKDLDVLNRKRYLAYRSLFYYPNTILDELDTETAQYIKNMRGRINEDIEKYLEGELILSKNMGFISFESSSNKDLFPNYRRVISDIALLVNSYIKDLTPNQNDKIEFTEYEFKKLLNKIHEENKMFFSKEYREMPENKFMENIIDYMQNYDLLKYEHESVTINPICFLISGKYPEIKEKEKEENNENYDLFSIIEEE